MRYCYLRIYQALKKVRTNDTPGFNALLLLGLLQSINIATVLALLKYFIKIDFGKSQILIGGLIISFLLLIIEFKSLFGNLDKICKQYANESQIHRRSGSIFVILYILFSLLLLFLVVETLI